MDRISIFLADWQVLFREGIHFTLSGEEDMDVIGEATASEEVLRAVRGKAPRVAVLNAEANNLSGIRACRLLKQNFPMVAVLLILDTAKEESLFLAIQSGALGCLTKDADPADLVDGIRQIAYGGYPACNMILRPAIAGRILAGFEEFAAANQQVDNLLAELTPDEAEVLKSISQRGGAVETGGGPGSEPDHLNRQLRAIATKLVTNDHSYRLMEAARNGHRGTPVIGEAETARAPADFITRGEFTAFKDTFWERFRSALDDIK
jgi:DNA-binding NarL/FixJ family response regulator